MARAQTQPLTDFAMYLWSAHAALTKTASRAKLKIPPEITACKTLNSTSARVDYCLPIHIFSLAWSSLAGAALPERTSTGCGNAREEL